ncbi:MAG: oxidative damage protection protein [Anaerolineae bacterium]|nr:oxidative damage protection protein [Anaerolineae bacterium]HNS39845.1 oxidative damage protection protein [Promineifilum sp.]
MTRETKTITVVQCAKFNQELPALDRPPFPGPLGQRLYNEVSRFAYSQWQEQARLIINHYGLNMADPQAQDYLFEQMEAFLFGGAGGVAAAPVAGGKGGPARK